MTFIQLILSINEAKLESATGKLQLYVLLDCCCLMEVCVLVASISHSLSENTYFATADCVELYKKKSILYMMPFKLSQAASHAALTHCGKVFAEHSGC